MTSFNDNEYASLIGNLINDTQYIKISNMGKVAGLRKHAEVMVRKILNIGSDTKIMLGQVRRDSNNAAINSRMEALGEELSNRLIEVVNKINLIGSAGTHTQHTEDFSDGEVEGIEDAILDLYALIFIRYFGDSQISIYYSPKILHEFSILPPIIRYKTWSYLFKKDKNNIQVVNKLCLSIIKTFNKERAYKWLEDNSEQIKAISYPTESEIKKYIQTGGVEVMPGLYQVSLDFEKYNNIYDLLYDKIKHSKTSINESGKMYKTFEEAINHYNNFKEIKIQDDSEDVAIFHSLMEFVYLGRKAKEDL